MYTENVDVNVANLTIKSENGSTSCIVQAASSGDHVFEVTVDYVYVTGFTAKGATSYKKAGIYLDGVEHCDLSDNTASNNSCGIYLSSSSNNSLTDNTANSNDGYAIYLSSSSNYNSLTNNAVSNNYDGIELFSSSNTLTSNNASNNGCGIELYSSSNNNTLTGNTANSNTRYGILLFSSSNNNTLTNNTANSNTWYGIELYSSSNNTLTNNNASNNGCGIELYSSSNNTLTNNSASNNTNYDFYSDENSHDNTIEDLAIASYPTTISFTYDQGIKIKGVTAPEPDPAGKVNISKYVNATNVTADSWLSLNVSYTDADVSGVEEDSLLLYRWNGTAWDEIPGSGVNTAKNYVYANVTNFSQIAPFGNPVSTPRPRGGGGGAPRDSDGDGISDVDEMLAGTDLNDPCEPNPECAACLAIRPPVPTPSPIVMPTPSTATPTIPSTVAPSPSPTPPPTPKPGIPGFKVAFAIAGLLAVAYLALRRKP
jgi:PGF-CTERM protein